MHSVCHPGVIAFAELECQVRMCYGITEPPEQLPVVVSDIAVVEGYHVAIALGQQIAVRKPAGSSLAIFAGREAAAPKHLQQALYSIAVNPKECHRSVEVPEECTGAPVL